MEDNCKLSLTPNSILCGLNEKVNICEELQEILYLESNTMVLTNLHTLLSYKTRNTNSLNIPLAKKTHFGQIQTITERNILDIIAKHCRFVNPRYKSIFITPTLETTISIEDLQPHPDIQIEIPEFFFMDNTLCPTCTEHFPTAVFNNHKGLGPFAEGHTLAKINDQELTVLVTLNVFTISGKLLPCNFCTTSFNLMLPNPEIHKHARQHAEHLLEPDENLQDAKRKLFKQLRNKEMYETATCLPCGRIFPNTRLLFLHLCLVEHKDNKHYCLQCKICIRTDLKQHIITEHPRYATCPYACKIPENELAHHIQEIHHRAYQVVPKPEIQIITKRKVPHWNNRITGQFGTLKIERKFHQEVNTLCSNPPTINNISDTFDYVEPLTKKICQNILNSRFENKSISAYHIPHIQENPLKFVSKILMIQRQRSSEMKREESALLAFTEHTEKPSNKAVLSESNPSYTDFMLKGYNVILVGNAHFKHIGSDQNIKIFNLSTTTNSVWNFNSLGTPTQKLNFEFNNFIETQFDNLYKKCELTIYLESSLHPFLEHIQESQRAAFLKRCGSNLATSLLKIAVQLQRKFKNVVVTTSLHTTYSKYYHEELQHVYHYNTVLKLGAIYLNLGILELDSLGFHTYKHNEKFIHFRTDSRLYAPIADFQGFLTEKTKEKILDLITNFEREREILKQQLPAPTVDYMTIDV